MRIHTTKRHVDNIVFPMCVFVLVPSDFSICDAPLALLLLPDVLHVHEPPPPPGMEDLDGMKVDYGASARVGVHGTPDFVQHRGVSPWCLRSLALRRMPCGPERRVSEPV